MHTCRIQLHCSHRLTTDFYVKKLMRLACRSAPLRTKQQCSRLTAHFQSLRKLLRQIKTPQEGGNAWNRHPLSCHTPNRTIRHVFRNAQAPWMSMQPQHLFPCHDTISLVVIQKRGGCEGTIHTVCIGVGASFHTLTHIDKLALSSSL